MQREVQVGRGLKRWLWASLGSLGLVVVNGCVIPPPPDPLPPQDGGVGQAAVLVKGVERHLSKSGKVETPMDFSTQSLELLRLEGGTFVPVEGRPLGPGQYAFLQVPQGPYYFKRGTNYIVTDSRTLDLSVNLIGRPDAQELFLELQPQARLDIDGLEPWAGPMKSQFIDLQVISEELGSMGQLLASDVLQEGQTSASGTLVDYWSVGKLFRFEAARGDRAWVTQGAPRTAGVLPDGRPLEYRSVVRSLYLPPFSFDGSQPFPVSGTFQPLPEKQLPVDWRLSSITAHAAEAHPAATVGTSYLYISPAQMGLSYGWVGYAGELLWLDMPLGHRADFQGVLTYGNPYPAQWEPVGQAVSFFRTRHTLPGATIPLTLSAGIMVSDTVANLSSRPIQPLVLPPRELRVDGTEAYTSRSLGLGGHVISWQHPAAGAPNAYRLTVSQHTLVNGIPRRVIAARFHVEGRFTSVTLPPEVLQPGSYYSLSLDAMASPKYTVADQNTVWHLPYSSASTVSGIFTTP
jgi:hypothetical protein